MSPHTSPEHAAGHAAASVRRGELPSRHAGRIDFNAQHSPMGAFMSFTCGHFGAGGGIGVEIGRPAGQNVYVGVKEGDRKSSRPVVCLPFVKGVGDPTATAAANYQVEQAGDAANVPPTISGVTTVAQSKVSRHYGYATDAWVAPGLEFAICTPFDAIPEPGVAAPEAMRRALLPAIVATLRVDNRAGTTVKTAAFAIDFADPGARVLRGDAGQAGFGWRRTMGVMASAEGPDGRAAAEEPFSFQRWSVAEGLADANPVHALGTIGGVGLEVPAGEVRTLVLAIGVYLDHIVTTGIEARYAYARHFAGLEDVLTSALSRSRELRDAAADLDLELASSRLTPDRQFMIAHGVRSYYGSTQLLEAGGEPIWVVNEGEYCMMNTLDLSVDQMFWELERNPWVVRNLLDHFAARYAYVDELRGPRGERAEGGVSFTHDMGVNNNFSPPGHSSYELAHLTGCFSYMTAEQLCNWLLMAATYDACPGADAGWAARNRGPVEACGRSLLNRCGDAGVIQFDSSRCQGGSEITTYDSLDPSLAQTRENLYMAVKCWASFLAISRLLRDEDAASSPWLSAADSAAESVVRQVGTGDVIPAVFEKGSPGYAARILPAIEGLVYPLYWRDNAALDERGRYGRLLGALRRHTLALLADPEKRNLFPDGGIRLSSTSDNSWMSKIALFMHVAREVYSLAADARVAKLFADADAAHVGWQTTGSAFWACSDQFVRGVAKGSRYYPRIVTAGLWLGAGRRSGTAGPKIAVAAK